MADRDAKSPELGTQDTMASDLGSKPVSGIEQTALPSAEHGVPNAFDQTMASDSGSPQPVSVSGVGTRPDDTALAPGSMAGEYRVQEFLGAGTFGDVYHGEHPVIGKRAAIKVLKLRYSVDPEMVSRFVSEARAVNQIGHQAIIDIFAFGSLPDGRQFYVMELLDGLPLDEHLEARGRLSLAETLAILRPIGEALDAAHQNGIAHRDLKPANVFLGRHGSGWRPKLLDFGVAKLMGDQETHHRTATGAAVGTPAYMAPEQCIGKDVDHRADIYAFGVVAFQMLSGALPFTAESAFSVMTKHINEPPPDLARLHADVGAPAARVVEWLLAKEPADRPPSLAAALDALEAAARGERVAAVPTPAKGAPWVWLSGAAIATVLAVGAWVALSDDAPPTTPVPATVPSLAAPTTAAPTTAAPASMVAPSTEAAPATVASAAPASLPAVIRLTVSGLPAKARIAGPGDAALGDGTAPIELPYGEEAIELNFSAPGYQPQAVPVLPDRDQALVVELKPKPRTRPTRPPDSKTDKERGLHDIEPW